MILKKSFYYLRHGKTDWNEQGLMQGQADIPLNAIGLEQAYEAQHYFENIKIDRICHSPLSRAKQTAEIINEKLQVPLISIEQLKEIYLGELEGQSRSSYFGVSKDTAKEKSWMHDWKEGNVQADKMEAYIDYKNRIITGINQALSYGENTLIVGHGMVHRTLLELFNFQGDLYLDNCTSVYHQIIEDSWLIIPLDDSDLENFS